MQNVTVIHALADQEKEYLKIFGVGTNALTAGIVAIYSLKGLLMLCAISSFAPWLPLLGIGGLLVMIATIAVYNHNPIIDLFDPKQLHISPLGLLFSGLSLALLTSSIVLIALVAIHTPVLIASCIAAGILLALMGLFTQRYWKLLCTLSWFTEQGKWSRKNWRHYLLLGYLPTLTRVGIYGIGLYAVLSLITPQLLLLNLSVTLGISLLNYLHQRKNLLGEVKFIGKKTWLYHTSLPQKGYLLLHFLGHFSQPFILLPFMLAWPALFFWPALLGLVGLALLSATTLTHYYGFAYVNQPSILPDTTLPYSIGQGRLRFFVGLCLALCVIPAVVVWIYEKTATQPHTQPLLSVCGGIGYFYGASASLAKGTLSFVTSTGVLTALGITCWPLIIGLGLIVALGVVRVQSARIIPNTVAAFCKINPASYQILEKDNANSTDNSTTTTPRHSPTLHRVRHTSVVPSPSPSQHTNGTCLRFFDYKTPVPVRNMLLPLALSMELAP